MGWNDSVEALYKWSTLGKRQAQIAVLSKTHSQSEIAEELSNIETTPPTDETIRSTKFKLTMELLKAITTEDALLNETSTPEVPLTHPAEMEPGTTTTHVYAGDIASGKTATARTHAKRLVERGIADNLLIIDPINEWAGMESEAHYETQQDIGRTLLQAVKEQPADENTVAVVDQAHILAKEISLKSDGQEIVDELKSLDHNLSLRLVGVNPSDLPESLTPDIYHFHRAAKTPSIPTMIRDIESETDRPFQRSIASLSERLPTPKPSRPAYVITIDTETGDRVIRPNILSEDEQHCRTD